MFKKVKSLLLASLLVVSMSGNVFAAEGEGGEEAGATTEASTCIIKGNAGIHKEEDHLHTITKDDRQTQAKINAMIADLKSKVAEKNTAAGGEYLTTKEEITEEGKGWIAVYQLFDNDNDGDKDEILVEKIEYVVYTAEDQKDKGWVNLEITPETGDAIALGGLAIAGVAVVALALNNKKKNKK